MDENDAHAWIIKVWTKKKHTQIVVCLCFLMRKMISLAYFMYASVECTGTTNLNAWLCLL